MIHPGGSQKTRTSQWVPMAMLVAGLVLLAVFLLHTQGALGAAMRSEMDAWFHRKPSVAAPPVLAGGNWAPVAAGAELVSGFGWHGQGAAARWQPQVVLRVSTETPVWAGVNGRVVSRTAHQIVLQSGRSLTLKESGLIGIQVSVGERVAPATLVATGTEGRITLALWDQGLPVNPLATLFFGSGWVAAR
ncbi:hypothetical protein TPY_0617 [Sulfobacillus acidophilus TPY]|uniref:Peptidase M23 domain-containing protein n=1 Tax=Sulfobacillus acidophilus (strain ATCC 700253 / DSM 10332 / NAL) TaxID=679936 RepID=G8U0D6_SULAD|nr:hypothetical protein TPY_0617 [Sulfobacillus acidophilus TPY]AEW06478.1 hypothetical protein Sulac_3021 [Sulfobacillus acidophilus DSM 10332]